MKLPSHLTIKNNHLHIGGQDCVALAEQYGTPLYVTNEDRVCEQFASYQKALSSRYPKVQVLFAAKANGNLALMRALARLGAGADIFSSGELHLALDAGMLPENFVLGNGSDELIDLTIKTLLEADENMVTSEGTFLEYEIIAQVNDRKVKKAPLSYFKYDLAAMLKLVDKKTKLVFIANPNNPTGT